MKLYTSTEICQLANVTKKTLRHYNKLKLLTPSAIEENGYWYYDERDLARLQLIKNLRTVGLSLSEIKDHLDDDCKKLRQLIPEKLQYINEQIVELEMAKRLLKKMASKTDLTPIEAINTSLEEEHFEWFKKNLEANQFDQVNKMMSAPESMEDHDQLLQILIKMKPLIKSKDLSEIHLELGKIALLFQKYGLDDHTVKVLLEAFIKSNLEGPLSNRILSLGEATFLLSLL